MINSFTAMTFFSCIALEFVLINNQECKIRPEILNINSNEPLFYPYSIEVINAVAVVIILMTHIQMLSKHKCQSI